MVRIHIKVKLFLMKSIVQVSEKIHMIFECFSLPRDLSFRLFSSSSQQFWQDPPPVYCILFRVGFLHRVRILLEEKRHSRVNVNLGFIWEKKEI